MRSSPSLFLAALMSAIPAGAQMLGPYTSTPTPLEAELDPSMPQAGVLKDDTTGDWAAQRSALVSALRTDPEDYASTLRYAYLSYLLKDYPAAKTYYERAKVLGPREQAPVEGLFYTALGRDDGTWREPAEALLKMDPGHRDANLKTAFQDFSLKRYQDALRAYGRLLSKNPDDADALLGAGWSQLYLGDCPGAHARFRKVLALAPGSASAAEGLRTCRSTYRFGLDAYFAGLEYASNPVKKKGHSYSFPITVSRKDRWSLTAAPIFTRIDYVAPNEDQQQIEANLSGSYHLTPGLSFIGAYDHIWVNDDTTDHSHVATGGLNYLVPLDAAQSWFASLGGSYSYSAFNHYHVSQFAPHAGIVWSRKAFLDFSLMETLHNGTGEELHAYAGSLTLGPFDDLSLGVKGYIGKKRSPVEEWGTLVANNQDLYKSGWRLGATWGRKDLSLYAIWGRDFLQMRVGPAGRPVFRPPVCPPPPAVCPAAPPARMTGETWIDYRGTTVVGGFSCRFGPE